MRKDPFFSILGVLTVLAACGGIASAGLPPLVGIAGRVERGGSQPPAGARATLRLDDDAGKQHLALPVRCSSECTFRGRVPAGVYRVSLDGPFAVDGHPTIAAERLVLRDGIPSLRLEVPDRVTIAGALADHIGCPRRLPSVTFRRLADGEEFGAAVSCSEGAAPGFAASIDPGEYDVRVELPNGNAVTARNLRLRSDATDVPLGILLPAADDQLARR